jgi:hypothetical protein
MDRDAHAREVIVRLVEDQSTEVARALERGGLPNEQEQAGAYDALMRARDRLEAITWRVEGIAQADRGDLPSPVTLAEIGTVAVIADDAERMAGELEQFAERLRGTIGALDVLRDTSETGISTGGNS